MKRTLLTLACGMAIFAYSYAATITWTGATDSDWDTASNWDAGVPTATDDVGIDDGTVVLSSTATVLRISLLGSSELTIDAAAILNIDGYTLNDDGLEVNNSASVINDGTLNVSNINGGVGADGIYLRGVFTNNGTVTISNTAQHGMYMQRGTFTNNAGASLTISASGLTTGGGDNLYIDDSSGIFSLFTNNGTVTLTTMIGADDGIYINDGSSFENNSMVTINSVSDNGIRLDDGGIFNNNSGATFVIAGGADDQLYIDNSNAMFVNDGTVTLTNGSDVALYVTDSGNFVNNAVVNISNSSNYSIQIDANTTGTADITNNGTITVTGGSNDGVRIQEGGTFSNAGTLILDAIGDSSGDAGIQIDDNMNNSTFNNSGMIDIINSINHGMELFGTFNNLNGATFQADNCGSDGIRVQNSGLFNNDGAIQIDNSASEDIETETIASWINTANATFTPGSSPGDLEIRDDYDMGASMTTFEINGTSAVTDYDQIINTVTANTLTISPDTKIHLEWGFVPAVNDCFTLIDGSGAISGTFNLANVTSSDPSIVYEFDYSNVGEVIICILPAMPIELIYFKGEETERGSKLDWVTASELNNEGFDIERSNNGLDWDKIAFVKGNGDSKRVVQYSYMDKSPANGTNYYRLKQNDYDGNFEFSNVIALEYKYEKNELSFYPNPIENILYIDAHGRLDNADFQLLDFSGKVLWSHNGMVTQIPFGDYSPGVYYVSITNATNQIMQKVIKK